MQWEIGAGGGLGLALVWLYFMGWSAYGFESVAAFAPEYHDTETDTPRALRASAAFSVVVYALLPLGVGGTMGTAAVAEDATGIAFYTQAFDILVGSGLANVMIVCLVAGLLLSMNTATMDGSRALFGIARDGMTIKQLGVLQPPQRPRAGDDARRASQHLPDHLLRERDRDPRGGKPWATSSPMCSR